MIYDLSKLKIIDHINFSEGVLARRMFHGGFKIGKHIYSVGGQSMNGRVLDDFVEINYELRKQKGATVERGKHLLSKLYS